MNAEKFDPAVMLAALETLRECADREREAVRELRHAVRVALRGLRECGEGA